MNTPTEELKIILASINNRDEKNFNAHVDLKSVMDIGYEETTNFLADNCAKFHKLYPKDLFFKFGSTILRIYNKKFRGVHLGLINKVIAAYFDGSFAEAKSFSQTPIKFMTAHLVRLLKAIHAEYGEEKISGDTATVAVKMIGDGSEYGRMIDTINFVVEFNRHGEQWHMMKIKNVEEVVPKILDIAETYWPSSWDLGIKL
ncbi:MAG: hypothetical protein K6G55_06190 [Selenomonadaceae bacterium]|nr:hypothetical protein [Selenomonadaceae bacterium]